MKDFFEIVTLSDCVGCRKTKTTLRDGMSPIDIIIGGVDFISKIFGFGNKSRALTSADWQRLFPASGSWTNRLRSYLASHISWDTDLKNIQPFTQYFIHENLNELSGGKWANLSTAPSSAEWAKMVQDFYNILSEESKGAGGYNQAGMFGDLGIVPLLLLGGLVFGFMGSPTKRRKSK
jgi:hypothetical protein